MHYLASLLSKFSLQIKILYQIAPEMHQLCTDHCVLRRKQTFKRLSVHWRNLPILTEWNLQILTVCALRMLGKIVFVIVLPISGSCQSIAYRSVTVKKAKAVNLNLANSYDTLILVNHNSPMYVLSYTFDT